MKNLRLNKKLWDLFVRKEEYQSIVLDEHGRFPSSAVKHNKIEEPEVSKYLIRKGTKYHYPHGKKFAVCLTHDIDRVDYPIYFGLPKALLKGEIKRACRMFLRAKYNLAWNFDQILKIEKEYNAKSSFYFLAIEEGDRDFSYNIERMEDVLKMIVSKGSEIGLHGGYDSYNSLDKLKREKDKLENVLGKEIVGYRNHFLRFKVPVTWELLEEAGFKYDTTFGYAKCVGFRNGMCHPFIPFNLKTKRYIDLLEIPLVVMDSTFIAHMNLSPSAAWEVIKKLIDTIEKLDGVITILWHNIYYVLGGWDELYCKILDYCSKKNAWLTSGEDIWNWWKANNFFEENEGK